MIVRIAGVTIPNNKQAVIALTYIYGIGDTMSAKILASAKIKLDTRVNDLTEDEVNRLRVLIEKQHRVEGDLRRDVQSNVKRLKEISSYRGIRHARKLPTRGQRTRTNSRTVRGNMRRTMGSGRRDAAQKT